MKSETSFFDRTVLKKDITRFMPLWLLYLIGGLLLAISSALSWGSSGSFANALGETVGPLSILSLCYGLLAAQLLYGDLFNSRLCNALHAMPLRRESWFATHFAAGLLFALVPDGIIALAMMPFLGQFWYTALLWLLGMLLHYLFFFALAVLCMQLSGNRLAATALYAMLNFLSPLAMWFCNAVYQPLLYGVVLSESPFALLCPVWALSGMDAWFSLSHDPNCPCQKEYVDAGVLQHQYLFDGMGQNWLYPVILAVLGLALVVAALALYRRRQLECAGDFVAFRCIRPAFCVVYTLCVGAMLHLIGTVFDDSLYIFMSIGLIVGYFTGRMLLGRTLRVFQKRSWAGLALIFLLFFVSLGLCRLDAFGIVHYVPEQEDVASIRLSQGLVDNLTEARADLVLTDQEDIRQMRSIHSMLIEEGSVEDRDGRYSQLTICYVLSDGRQISRQYRPARDGEGANKLNTLFLSRPEIVLKTNSLEQLQRTSKDIFAGIWQLPSGSDGAKALLKALYTDCRNGRLFTTDVWPTDGMQIGTVNFAMESDLGLYYNIYLIIWDTSTSTTEFFREEIYRYVTAEQLAASIETIEYEEDAYFRDAVFPMAEFSRLLLEDLLSGSITVAPENGGNLNVWTASGWTSFLCTKDSGQLYAFMQNWREIPME